MRTPEQAEAVKKYGAEPLIFDAYDEAEVKAAVNDNSITVVYHLISPRNHISQSHFIKALAEVKKSTGHEVHFLHVGTPNASMRGTCIHLMTRVDNGSQDILIPRRRADGSPLA